MDFLSIFLIAVGLSMDAMAVSLTQGICCKKLICRQAVTTAFFFGLFQGLMPLIGWLVGVSFSDKIKEVDHWIAFILLAFIGGKMLWEAVFKKDEKEISTENTTIGLLLVLSVATSIDALAVGVSFAFVGSQLLCDILISCGLIALTTFVISFIGFFIGRKFGCLLKKYAEIIGGIILIGIGTKILIEHLMQ